MTTTVSAQGQGLMVQLKEATADLHRHAETRELQKSLIRGAASPATYRRYLVELHAVHAALERGLTLWLAQRPELGGVFTDAQRHSRNIEQDIASLGALSEAQDRELIAVTLAGQKLIDFLATHMQESPFSLLGGLYVLEGSMNGNRFLARALGKAWHVDRDGGLRYLDPYGEAQQATWQYFRTAMDNLEASEKEIATAVESACATFEAIAAISDEIVTSN